MEEKFNEKNILGQLDLLKSGEQKEHLYNYFIHPSVWNLLPEDKQKSLKEQMPIFVTNLVPEDTIYRTERLHPEIVEDRDFAFGKMVPYFPRQYLYRYKKEWGFAAVRYSTDLSSRFGPPSVTESLEYEIPIEYFEKEGINLLEADDWEPLPYEQVVKAWIEDKIEKELKHA